jgi:hypothetical protein
MENEAFHQSQLRNVGVGKFRAISRSTRGGKEASPLPEDQRIGAPQADPAHGDGVLAEVDEQLPLPRPVDHVILLSYTIASSHSLWLGARKGSVSWRERGRFLHLHQCDGSWLPGYVAFSPKFWCNAKTWGEGARSSVGRGEFREEGGIGLKITRSPSLFAHLGIHTIRDEGCSIMAVFIAVHLL